MIEDAALKLAQHVCRTGYTDLPVSAVESARPASGQITMRKIDGWQTLPENLTAPETTPSGHFHTIRDGTASRVPVGSGGEARNLGSEGDLRLGAAPPFRAPFKTRFGGLQTSEFPGLGEVLIGALSRFG
jgi:hypothetical protein